MIFHIVVSLCPYSLYWIWRLCKEIFYPLKEPSQIWRFFFFFSHDLYVAFLLKETNLLRFGDFLLIFLLLFFSHDLYIFFLKKLSFSDLVIFLFFYFFSHDLSDAFLLLLFQSNNVTPQIPIKRDRGKTQ